MALILRIPSKPAPLAFRGDVTYTGIQSAGVRGITARELAKAFPGRKAESFWPTLKALLKAGKVRQEWTACADWRDHSAAQEGRYYAV